MTRTKLERGIRPLIVAVGVCLFLLSSLLAPHVNAQITPPASTFKHDFLYKFLSHWSDITTDGQYHYVTNFSYSQIEKYNINGTFVSLWGSAGSGNGQLKQPMGIAYANDHIYVADTGNSRIQQFDASTYAYMSKWGSLGTGDGNLYEPQGIAVNSGNPETYVFIADTKNNRIAALNLSNGTFVYAGSLGAGDNQLSAPRGIAVWGTAPTLHVLVADSGNNRVVEYLYNTTNNTFTFDADFGTYGNTSDVNNVRFNQPNKIHVGAGNMIYVTDKTNRIQKFDSGRNFQSQWNVRYLQGTTGLTSFNTTLYVVEPYNQIDSYSAQTGNFSSSFFNEANQPVDIALDLSGNIYINNNTTNTIVKFNSSWVPQVEWGGNGGTFDNPLGIGVNTGGEVCVADTTNNRIQRFETNGSYMASLPAPIVTPAGFNRPRDIAIESTGKMYVADSLNNRILKYKSDNTADWAIGMPTPTIEVPPGPLTPTPVAPTGPFFLNPYGITVDSQNKIYVADSGYHRIQKFDANGLIEKAWGEYGSADNRVDDEGNPIPQFDNPQGMAIEQTGDLSKYFIYVADTGNNRIQRFDQDGVKDPTRDVWGVYGTGDGQFNEPRNITLDSAKRIYVSEVQNKRIQVFGDATVNAGLTILETGSTAVTEDGSVYDSYTVKLNTQPSANVSVDITSSDSARLAVSSPSLTFTPYNWNIPQTVTVLPLHDNIDQPTTQSIILSHAASSADANYNSNGSVLASVQVTMTDTDTSGVVFSKTAVSVNESGGTDNYTVALNSKPTANVALAITSADGQTLSNGQDPLTLTFTPLNWATPQPVIVSAVHDFIANGTRDSYINFATTTDDTSGYVTPTFPTFIASISDSLDTPGVTLTAATMSLTEGGAAGTYTVVLNSKPMADVAINIATLSGTQDLAITPNVLTFTPDTFNISQTVSVLAVNDKVVNSDITNLRTADISHIAASTDADYGPGVAFTGGTSPGNIVRATITDIDQKGFVLSKSMVTVVEGQTSDSYTIALSSKPTGQILLALSLPPAFEATTGAETYTYLFKPDNWNIPQTITVTSTNDGIYQGTHSATLLHTVVSSTDSIYTVGDETSITVRVIDTDLPSITIRQPNGVLNLTEYGIDDTYFIKLSTQPLANVTVNINGGSQVTASPSSLLFTTANWNVEQPATLSAINDFMVEGTHTAPVIHTTSSSDAGYNNISTILTVNITDDDSTVPGVQITQTDGGTTVTEGGPEDTYTIVLTSRPSAYVRIRVLSDNTEATTSGALFTFLPTTWNIPQTVHVVAKNDTGADGTKTTVFRHLLTSLDPHYGNMTVETVTVTANDNDGLSLSGASAAKPPICSSTPPSSAPHLFQADARSHSATLYFTPIRDNISYYFVAYGYKPGDIRFGTSFDFGSYDGVIDHTINMLNPGETYYFKVRGGNGCATGQWSNTLAATTTASGSAAMRTTYAPAASYASTSTGGSSGGSSSGASHPQFARTLSIGSRGADVRSLQMYLNQQGFTVAQSGPGSPGNETDIYGGLTANAIRRFQEANYGAILSPLGYSSGTGVFGPSTRNYVNAH